MKNFILGFVAANYLHRNRDFIIKALEKQIAKLELKRDIIEHDNPDLA